MSNSRYNDSRTPEQRERALRNFIERKDNPSGILWSTYRDTFSYWSNEKSPNPDDERYRPIQKEEVENFLLLIETTEKFSAIAKETFEKDELSKFNSKLQKDIDSINVRSIWGQWNPQGISNKFLTWFNNEKDNSKRLLTSTTPASQAFITQLFNYSDDEKLAKEVIIKKISLTTDSIHNLSKSLSLDDLDDAKNKVEKFQNDLNINRDFNNSFKTNLGDPVYQTLSNGIATLSKNLSELLNNINALKRKKVEDAAALAKKKTDDEAAAKRAASEAADKAAKDAADALAKKDAEEAKLALLNDLKTFADGFKAFTNTAIIAAGSISTVERIERAKGILAEAKRMEREARTGVSGANEIASGSTSDAVIRIAEEIRKTTTEALQNIGDAERTIKAKEEEIKKAADAAAKAAAEAAAAAKKAADEKAAAAVKADEASKKAKEEQEAADKKLADEKKAAEEAKKADDDAKKADAGGSKKDDTDNKHTPPPELNAKIADLRARLTELNKDLANQIAKTIKSDDTDEKAQIPYRTLHQTAIDEIEKKLDELDIKENTSIKTQLDELRTDTIRFKRNAKKEELDIRLLEFPYRDFKHFLEEVCKDPYKQTELTDEEKELIESYFVKTLLDFNRVAGAPLDFGVRKQLNLEYCLEKNKLLSSELEHQKTSSPSKLTRNRLFEELHIINETKIKRNIEHAKIVEEDPTSLRAKEYEGFTLSFAKAEYPVEVIHRTDSKCNDLSILLKGKVSNELSQLKKSVGGLLVATEGKGTFRIRDAVDSNKIAIHPLTRDAKKQINSGFANFLNTEKQAYVSQVFAEKKEMRLAFHMANALDTLAKEYKFKVPGQLDQYGKLVDKDPEQLEKLRIEFFQGIVDKIQGMPYPHNQITKENISHVLQEELKLNAHRQPTDQFEIELGRDLLGRGLGNFAGILHDYIEQKTTQAMEIPGEYYGTNNIRIPKNEYFDVAIRMLSSLIADSKYTGVLYFYNSHGNPKLLEAMRIVADAKGLVYKDQTGYGFKATTQDQIKAYNVLCTKVEFKQLRGDTALFKESAPKLVKEFTIGSWLGSGVEKRNDEVTLADLLRGEVFSRPTASEETLDRRFTRGGST